MLSKLKYLLLLVTVCVTIPIVISVGAGLICMLIEVSKPYSPYVLGLCSVLFAGYFVLDAVLMCFPKLQEWLEK